MIDGKLQRRRSFDVRSRAQLDVRRLPESGSDTRALLCAYHRTRDPATRSQLIEAHLPLVQALARRYAHRGERLEDLVQVGTIGLIEAIDRFDPARGRDLAGFAVPTITGEIRNHLRDRTATIRVPRRLVELATRVASQREALTVRLSRSPTVSELAREAGMCAEDVADAIETERARTPSPLPAADGASGKVDRGVVVEGAFDASEDRLLLAAGFRTLAERERRILHLRFFEGLSQAEIAHEVGLSQIQVSRLIRASLERMRGALADSGPHGPPLARPVRL